MNSEILYWVLCGLSSLAVALAPLAAWAVSGWLDRRKYR